MGKALYVGEVARQAGVNLQTVHYYERRGLIPGLPRSSSGYRLFDAETVSMIRFIRRAQELGFTLKEIQELLELRAAREGDCGGILEIARRKVRLINDKISDLEAMRDALETLMESCSRDKPIVECPIIENLERNGKPLSASRIPVPGRRRTGQR